MKRVGAVICNYNKCDDVMKCIQSVLESQYQDYDLYVVDNASADDSVRTIRETYGDRLTLIENAENLGGSGGFNTGLRRALQDGHEYLYLLDNDVLVDECAMGNLVAFLDAHPDTGMVGSRVYQMEEPYKIQQAGQSIDFREYCTEANYLGCTDQDEVPDVVYCDAVAACSLMVRRTLVDKIGLMPEDNFLYWDDTEWGYRCNLSGQRVASISSSVVLHKMGAKKESVNTFPTYYAWRNWIDFFIRYTPQEQLESMCRTFLGSVFEVLYEGIYHGEENKSKTVIHAYQDAIHHIRGKAGPDRIFELDHNDSHLLSLLDGKHKIYLEQGSSVDYADYFMGRLSALAPEAQLTLQPEADCDLSLVMVEDLFHMSRMDLDHNYIDIDLNLCSDAQDAKKILDFYDTKQAFIQEHLNGFLEQARKIRKLQPGF